MSLRSLRSRVARLVSSAPAALALPWAVVCGDEPPADPSAEVAPGAGFSWAEAMEPTPVTDPLDEYIARLPPEPPKPAPLGEDPDQTARLVPATNPVDETPTFPPGYEPDPT